MEVPKSVDVRREPYRRLLARLAAGMEAQTGEPFVLFRDHVQAEAVASMFGASHVETEPWDPDSGEPWLSG